MALTEGIGGFLSVSAATPATFDAAGYVALTFVEVGEVSEVPEFGAAYSPVTFTPLKTGIVNKFHGELNYGSITVPLGYDSANAGQIILLAALASRMKSASAKPAATAQSVISWVKLCRSRAASRSGRSTWQAVILSSRAPMWKSPRRNPAPPAGQGGEAWFTASPDFNLNRRI